MGRKIELQKKSVLKQIDLIVQVATILTKENREDGMTSKDWVKVVWDLHKKGWLYVTAEGNKVTNAIAGYRVKKIPSVDDESVVIPDFEEGDIFYIPFYVPKAKALPIRKVIKFLRNNKEISSVAYENDKGEIRQSKMRKKESTDEWKEKSRNETANV